MQRAAVYVRCPKMAYAMSKQHYLHSTNDETKQVTGGCEREMTTTRHPVNATVLTGYNVDRRVNSTFGRCAVVCEKTKQQHSQLSRCNRTYKLQCCGINSKSSIPVITCQALTMTIAVTTY